MRILGLDVGDVRIGVAVSDPLGVIAQPLASVRRISVSKDVEFIKHLAEENEAGKIVVGIPKTLDDEVGIQAQKVLDFADSLGKALEIPIVLWDERLTTAEAERALIEADMSRRKRKKVIDKVAAVLILQGYLDSHIQKMSS
jgi:putative Holliday junction resolvase